MVERAWQRRRPDCSYLFHVKGRPIGAIRKTWNAACCEIGLGRMEIQETGKEKQVGLIPHDLRRTAVRNMVRAGVREHTAMKLSGHKTRSIFDRYDIVDEDDLAQGSEKVQSYLREQSQKSKVVAISKAV